LKSLQYDFQKKSLFILLLKVMSKYDIRFNSSPIEKFDAAVPETIILRINQLEMQRCEVIFYILNEAANCIYHLVKFLQNYKNGKIYLYYQYRIN